MSNSGKALPRRAATILWNHLRARHAWYWVPLVYVAAAVLLYHDIFFPDGPRPGFGWDTIEAYWGDLAFLSHSLADGASPLWNPYEYGGVPALAKPQTGIYYPLNAPLALYGAAVGETSWWLIQLKMIGHHVIAGIAMHGFLRARGLGHAAALIGGLAWMASAPMLIHKASAILLPMVWTPLVWLAIDRMIARPTWRSGVGLGAALVLVGVTGSPPGFFYVLLMAAPYGLLRVMGRLWTERGDHAALLKALRSLLTATGIAALLTVGMLLVVVVPTQELTSLSSRADLRPGFALLFPLPPKPTLVGMLAPGAGKYDAYAGIVVAMLAACALTMRPRRDRGACLLFALLAAVFMAMAFGKATPILPWLAENVPGFKLFRAANRYKILAMPMLAALAAFGAQNLLDAPRRFGRERIIGLVTAVLAVVAVVWVVDAFPTPAKLKLAPSAHSVWLAATGALLISGALLLPRRFAIVPVVLAAAVIVWDPQHFVHHTNPALERRPDNLEDRRWLAGLEDVTAHWRVWDEFAMEQRAGSRLAIKEMRGYPAGSSLEYIPYGAVTRFARAHPEILAAYGVRYVLWGPHRRIGMRAHLLKKRPDQAAPGVFTRVRDRVFEARSAAPLVAWYGDVARVPTGQVLPTLLAGLDRDAGLWRRAVIDDDAAARLGAERVAALTATAGVAPAAANPVAATIERYDHDRVRARVVAPGPGLVVLNDVMYPGWRVRVDGREETPVFVNRLVRGVYVDAGEHVVEWRFAPAGHTARNYLFTIGLYLILAAAFLPDRQRMQALLARMRSCAARRSSPPA